MADERDPAMHPDDEVDDLELTEDDGADVKGGGVIMEDRQPNIGSIRPVNPGTFSGGAEPHL